MADNNNGGNEGNGNNPGNRLARLGSAGVQQLSVRQKNIVNPYAQDDCPPGYSLNSARNKWVLAGIHDCYINFGYFPTSNSALKILEGSPLTDEDNIVTQNDLKAYLALYPQNGVLTGAPSNQIKTQSARESYFSFVDTVDRLTANGATSFYTSPSSPEAQLPQNQGAISLDRPATDDAAAQAEWSRLTLVQNISQLVAIPYDYPRIKLNLLRETFDNPLYSSTRPPVESISDPTQDIVPFNPEDVDLEDWRNNAPPGSFSPKIYYNFKDEHYYFVQRTNSVVNEDYDPFRLDYSQSNISQALRAGIKGILKFAGKYTDDTWDLLSRRTSDQIVFVPYKHERPNSRWLYTVKIPKSFLTYIEVTPDTSSLYEDALDPFQISQILIDPSKNNTTQHMIFAADYFSDNLGPLVEVISYYHDILKLQGLEDGKLDGINLSAEIDSIKGMPTDVNNIISLNNIQKDTPANVDFCLSDLMKINYLVIEGTLCTKFLGQTLFTPRSSDELENQINLSVINNFSAQSPASIGYWYETPGQNGIFKNTKGRQREDWPAWVDFLTRYHKPTPALSPEVIEDAKNRSSLINAFLGEAPKPKIFETLSDIMSNSPSPSGNPSFASFAEANLALIDGEKALDKALANCQTPLSKLTKDLKFLYKWSRGKISTDALVAKAINELRSQLLEKNIKLFQTPPGEDSPAHIKVLRDEMELPQDPLDPIYVQAAQGNPSKLVEKIEKYIDRVLACMLPFDDINATLQKQLRQSGAPPELQNLVLHSTNAPISIKLRKQPYRKNKSETYWKLIEEYAVRFIKQLILGVIVQMLEALLGCGPEDKGASPEELASRLQLYGFIDINDFIEGVDVLKIATSVGFRNKTIKIERSGLFNRAEKVLTITSDPRLDQLEQFHNDLSAITTPEEIKALLKGESNENLLDLIMEMIERGNINIPQLLVKYPEANGQILRRDRGPDEDPEEIPIGQLEGTGAFALDGMISNAFTLLGQPELRVITNEFQDSLRLGDVRYASLSFTKERLVSYFKQIGKELGTATVHSMTTDPPQIPAQSYCPDPQPTFDFLSDLQIKSQLADEISTIQNKMSDLCEVNDGLFDFENWWEAIEMPEELKKILEWLKKIGDWINKALTDLMSDDDALSAMQPASPAEKDCADFQNTLFWDQVGSNDWYEGELGSRLSLSSGNLYATGALRYQTPIKLPIKEITDEQLQQAGISAEDYEFLSQTLSTWEMLGRPTRAEQEAAYEALEPAFGNELRAADWIIRQLLRAVGVPDLLPILDDDPATPGRQYDDAKIVQIYANVDDSLDGGRLLMLREALLGMGIYTSLIEVIDSIKPILHTLRLYLFIERFGWSSVELFLEQSTIGELFVSPSLELAVDGQAATIFTKKGKTLAKANFRIELNIEPDRDVPFERTIYENLEAKPWPEEAASPPGSPPVTLWGLRDESGRPTARLLNVLNKGRQSAGLGSLNGSPSTFIPSIGQGWVREVLSALLKDGPDSTGLGLLAGTRNSLTSIQHTTYDPGPTHVLGDNQLEPLDFYLQLCHTFYKPQSDAPNPLEPSMNIINQIPFVETPDRCAKLELSRSMMQSLRLRLAPFLINILPLMRVYKGFNSPTTINLLSDYLRRKIKEDFKDHDLNTIFEENIDWLFLLYQGDLSEGKEILQSHNRNTFSREVDIGGNRSQMDLSYETYDFKLDYIIQKYLIATFSQWWFYTDSDGGNTTPYPHMWAYQENFYDPKGKSVDLNIPHNTFYNYGLLCRTFFERLKNNANVSAEQVEALTPLATTVLAPDEELDPDQWTAVYQLGAYYFPAPAMLGAYAIVHDHIIKTSESFYLYKAVIEGQKRADDIVKSIISPTYVPGVEQNYGEET